MGPETCRVAQLTPHMGSSVLCQKLNFWGIHKPFIFQRKYGKKKEWHNPLTSSICLFFFICNFINKHGKKICQCSVAFCSSDDQILKETGC